MTHTSLAFSRGLVVAAAVLAFASIPATVFAADTSTITDATINGVHTLDVQPSASITANVIGKITGSNNWRGTLWSIASGSSATTCADTANHTVTPGSYSSGNFSIIAPGAQGSYNANFIMAGQNDCTGATSAVFQLPVYVDGTAPVITLSGTNSVDVFYGATYTDAGATASDDHDGNITGSIVTNNPVNTSVLGDYTVTYNVSDAAGNAATQVTRTVHVIAGAPITGAATAVTSSDATLNGTNGPSDATGHSFWVSLSSIDTSSPTVPAGVYSTPDLGFITASSTFSASLSSLTTTGYPSNLPAITGGTTYYYVAWTNVGGTWYPGTEQSFTTAPVPLTATITAGDKTYDGTTAVTPDCSLTGSIVLGDDVACSASGTNFFIDKNVGTGKVVTATGITLTGADASHYSLVSASATTTASINALPITVTASDNTKVYDATTTASALPVTSGVASGDTANFSESYDTKDVGTGKTLTPSGFVNDGTVGGTNYTYTFVATSTGAITSAPLTISGMTASNKVYDATTAATVDFSSATLVTPIVGDDVLIDSTAATATFGDKNVGTGKTVTVTGVALSGTDAGDYSLTQPTATADITARPLTVAATGYPKVYDGTTVATVSVAPTDALLGDHVNATYTDAEFATSTVGTDIEVDVTGISLYGADAGNYTPNSTAVTSADITTQSADVTLDPASQDIVTYDGTPKSLEFDTNPPGLALAITYDGHSTPPTDAGTYTVLAAVSDPSSPDYAGQDTETLIINKAAPTIVVTPYSVTYDGAAHTATGTATGVASEDLSAGFDFSGTTHTDAGTYGTDSWSFTGGTDYLDQSGSISDVISPADQTITFDALPDLHFTAPDFDVSATSTSGLAPTFAASGDCTVSGSTVHLTGVGSCTITASQSGDADYNAAPDVAQTFNITDTAPTVNDLIRSASEGLSADYTLEGSDSDGDALTYSIVTAPTEGTAVVNGDKVTYTAPAGFTGNDSFTYKANDGGLDSNVGTVSIAIGVAGGGGGGGSILSGGGSANPLPGSGTTAPPAAPTGGQVLGASTYNFAKNLYRGLRNADVMQLQQFLIAEGYSIPAGATGYFGSQTFAAVQAFQKANGIPTTGFVGPLTRAVLNQGIIPTKPE